MKKTELRFCLWTWIGVMALAVGMSAFGASTSESLYRRLGGRAGILPIVDNFVEMVMADPRVRLNSSARQVLDGMNTNIVKSQLFEIVCLATGGPCRTTESGHSLRKLVRSMELTPSDWDAVMADFSAAMAKFKVPSRSQNDLRLMMEPVKAEVIYHGKFNNRERE